MDPELVNQIKDGAVLVGLVVGSAAGVAAAIPNRRFTGVMSWLNLVKVVADAIALNFAGSKNAPKKD